MPFAARAVTIPSGTSLLVHTVDRLSSNDEAGKSFAARLDANLVVKGNLLFGAEVVWAVRAEMARTVEDVLARRTRALLLGARASIEAAPWVAEFMARELKRDADWQKQTVQNFKEVAQGYLPPA